MTEVAIRSYFALEVTGERGTPIPRHPATSTSTTHPARFPRFPIPDSAYVDLPLQDR